MKYGADCVFKRLRSVIVAEPTFYGIDTPINEWQERNVSVGVDRTLAIRQHREMVRALEKLNVECHYLESIPDATEQKDVRDLGVITAQGAIVGHFNHRVRMKEVAPFISFLDKHNIEILRYGVRFEGGDCFLYDETFCILGSGKRSQVRADELQPIINKSVLIVNHVASHHLDALFNVASPDILVMHKKYIASLPFFRHQEIVELDDEDIKNMAPNFLLIDEGLILADANCQLFNERLRRKGSIVEEVNVSELKKNGGSIRCMTLPLLQE